MLYKSYLAMASRLFRKSRLRRGGKPYNTSSAHRTDVLSCPLEQGIDNDLMILLAAQQRNLTSLSLGRLKTNALTIPESLLPWPAKLESIVVPYHYRPKLERSFYEDLVMRSLPTLRALTVRTARAFLTAPYFNTSKVPVVQPARNISISTRESAISISKTWPSIPGIVKYGCSSSISQSSALSRSLTAREWTTCSND